MSEPDDTSPEAVEFIPAKFDAQLRLDCFATARCSTGEEAFERDLVNAQTLYDWVMGTYEDGAEIELTGESDRCDRKH